MVLADFIIIPQKPGLQLEEVQLSEINRNLLQQLIKEYSHLVVLEEYGLPVDNKVFLSGHTGCGKTTTAIAIAQKLNKKIIILNLSNIVSSKLGETSKNISEVFKKAIRESAVLFLDEFDSIGKIRDLEDNDNTEMKRLVNTIIQLIDGLPSTTMLIAATNHISAVDPALLRRFQLRLKFSKPTEEQLDDYYDSLLANFPSEFHNIEREYNLSYAEAKDKTFRQLKALVIAREENKISQNLKKSQLQNP